LKIMETPSPSPSPASAREPLVALRKELLVLHRELIGSERIVFERSAGTIPSAAAFLQLLAHDPWFEWLRPLSQHIAAIDAALADKKEPLTAEKRRALLLESRALLTPDEHGDGFAKTYFDVLQRDPHVMVTHIEVRRLLASLIGGKGEIS
jgi:hypothetical protein